MAYDMNVQFMGTKTATANYSSASASHRFVTSTGDTVFTRVATSGAPAIGVLYDNPSSGKVGRIAIEGIVRVRCSTSHAAITPTNKIRSDNAGFAKPSTTAVGNYVIGRAVTGLGANVAGMISVYLTFEGAGSTSAATGS